MSKFSLYEEKDNRQHRVDPISDIFGRIREDFLRTKRMEYSWEQVLGLCRGFTVRFSAHYFDAHAHVVWPCYSAC